MNSEPNLEEPEHERLKACWHLYQKKYKSQTGHRMTQLIAAEKLGVSSGAIGQWLNGDETISNSRLVALCEIIEADPVFIRPSIPLALTITKEEERVLLLYRKMADPLKENWLGIAEAAASYETNKSS